jgi:hypothetical protein
VKQVRRALAHVIRRPEGRGPLRVLRVPRRVA